MPTRSTEQAAEVGRRLARARTVLGLTQDELAEQIGVTRGAIGNWEQGSRLADVSAMIRFSDRHAIPLEWLYRGSTALLPHALAARLADIPPHPPSARRRAG